MNSDSRTTGIALLAIFILLGLIALPFVLSGNNPAEWLQKNHERISGTDPEQATVVYRSDEDYDTTVAAIVAGTDPDEQTTGTNLLPYVPTSPLERAPSSVPATPPAAGTTPIAGHPATFMRYGSEWIVAVTSTPEGVFIELDEFDRGYTRHGTYLGRWSSHYQRGGFFRGGGSGFGK